MRIEGRKTREVGTFSISSGRYIYGELSLAGAKTSLYLHDTEFFDARAIRHLNGTLHDRTKVSLIDCISSGTGSGHRGLERFHDAHIFPHYIVYGDHHLSPDDGVIAELQFVVDDAATIFYDYAAFGSVINAQPFIEQIAQANSPTRKITTGPNPIIQYFTGQHEIFAVDTVFGRIAASHAPSFNMGGPKGVRMNNTIVVTISFSKCVAFEDAITRTGILAAYLGLLAGRPQNIRRISLRIRDTDCEIPPLLQVYWSMPPRRSRSAEGRNPHPTDVLLDGAKEPDRFSKVLQSWLDRQEAWHDARSRFFSSFAEQHVYEIDRLIGAANMFDILPRSAVPEDVPLTTELELAKSKSLELFRPLPKTPERESVLNALGRIGKANLKQKIRHRARLIVDALGDHFPELLTVTDEAVNCRNHYVHGSKTRIDYSENAHLVHFFIDTLEFVFAASDLIECGWDAKAWSKTPTSMSHPFGAYRIAYREMLHRLQIAVDAASRSKDDIS